MQEEQKNKSTNDISVKRKKAVLDSHKVHIHNVHQFLQTGVYFESFLTFCSMKLIHSSRRAKVATNDSAVTERVGEER